ncbi:MAG TPA: class I SAM-dependent methyltransferase [Opitutaceae bacterium]|nr:class I SAM-dependent methyltransferase [Opitutaceae bacterium]
MISISRILKPSNYVRKLRAICLAPFYDMAAADRDEAEKFTAAGLDRKGGLADLDAALMAMGQPKYSHSGGMASVHWLLFACLARQRSVARILEIGAYDGQTTALLARLFPDSEIVTLDLPANDPILQKTYARSNPVALAQYERRLEENTKAGNIKLKRINSFFLPAVVTEKFDLIWIDGGHLYPEVAWDICNCWHLVQPGGALMCDDVILHPRGRRDAYVSNDSASVLKYVVARTEERCYFFMKRASPKWSADPRERKFVALLQKGSGPGGK